MRTWIFQANPARFRLDEYLALSKEIRWTVRQEHLAPRMQVGDRVFIWRSGGDKSQPAGVVASGTITRPPSMEEDDPRALSLWTEPEPGPQLRVRIAIDRVADKWEILRRDWLKIDPVLDSLRILKLASETNYEVSEPHARRLEDLWKNTNVDWTEDESMAGLWAYASTRGREVSRSPGSPVAEVAVRIGRVVSGVYNKVMNFRALDPADDRKGLPAVSAADRRVWERYFDGNARVLDAARLDADYARRWGGGIVAIEQVQFGESLPERRTSLRGQGYEADPEVRKAIEMYAMQLARAWYESEGFVVEDTSGTCPYDLRCTKANTEVRVEVKGTRGDGSSVEVTIGEVLNARGDGWRTDLFIVSRIEIEQGDPPRGRSGSSRRIEGWRAPDEQLAATRYRCRVPWDER